VNTFSVEFLLACYQHAGSVWYVSGALRRTYTLFYPAPNFCSEKGSKLSEKMKAGNTKGVSITVLLASCLTGLESSV